MVETVGDTRLGISIPEQDDPRGPARRLAALFDPGSFIPAPGGVVSRVLVGRGTLGTVPAIAFCTDGTTMGGALGGAGARQIAAAIDQARRDGVPVVGLWHSGGASLGEGVEALDGIGQIFAATVRASGRIPQISVVLGPAAGGAAYGPALTDVVIMAPAGRVFVTGPDVVRSVTGEQIDMEGLGGAQAHGSRSGVVHVLADSEHDAFARARRLVPLLAGTDHPAPADHPAPDGAADGADPRALLPDRRRRAYDVRPLVHALLDADPDDPGRGSFQELQARWAANVVVGLGRLHGRRIGVIANNPLRKGGCLDSLSAEKAARFVRMCDAFGIPLLVVVDVPGYLPGVRQEWEGVVRRGAKLLYAFAEATVPRVTLVTRKSFGGAYIAMNSRSLGATAVFAWPDAELAVMGAEAAVGILHRRELAAVDLADRPERLRALAAEHQRTAGGASRAVELGLIDAVIEPADTRRRVAAAISEAARTAPAGRVPHGNIPL
ncbi:carboxyl transferase domain-containing protein [Parafrankia sp. FMc6]|uniref:acyl-CoA carboxylase subunit beta n=1 Tax=Parafrankia soli TaxID=2599596 RepID=UPI0034D5E541